MDRCDFVSRSRGMLGLALGDAHAGRQPSGGGLLACSCAVQLAAFTVEGLIRASVRYAHKGICHPPSVVWHAYQRWGLAQGLDVADADLALGLSSGLTGWLYEVPLLKQLPVALVSRLELAEHPAAGSTRRRAIRTGGRATRECEPARPFSPARGAPWRRRRPPLGRCGVNTRTRPCLQGVCGISGDRVSAYTGIAAGRPALSPGERGAGRSPTRRDRMRPPTARTALALMALPVTNCWSKDLSDPNGSLRYVVAVLEDQ